MPPPPPPQCHPSLLGGAGGGGNSRGCVAAPPELWHICVFIEGAVGGQVCACMRLRARACGAVGVTVRPLCRLSPPPCVLREDKGKPLPDGALFTHQLSKRRAEVFFSAFFFYFVNPKKKKKKRQKAETAMCDAMRERGEITEVFQLKSGSGCGGVCVSSWGLSRC